jgi:hypothetical protein
MLLEQKLFILPEHVAQYFKFTSCLPMVGGSPGTPASSTTKTGRHDIAEILLKVALSIINQVYLI